MLQLVKVPSLLMATSGEDVWSGVLDRLVLTMEELLCVS